MIRPSGWLAIAILASSGCATGSMTTVAFGPSLGSSKASDPVEKSNTGVVLSLEYTLLKHPPAFGSDNVGAYGVTAAVDGAWQNDDAGWNTAALIGGDFYPWMSRRFQAGYGGLIGYAKREDGSGLTGGFRFAGSLTPWRWGDASVGIGLRVECRLPRGALGNCGPRIYVTRVALGR